MKNLIFAGLTIVLFSCDSIKVENSDVSKLDCINKVADASFTKNEIKSKIGGTWKLEKVYSMLPTTKVPNIEIKFMDVLGAPIDRQVAEIKLDGKVVDTQTYTLIEENAGNIKIVVFESQKNLFDIGGASFGRAAVRICDEAMILDYGMSLDAPGYVLSKK